jgi:hypothetical protein
MAGQTEISCTQGKPLRCTVGKPLRLKTEGYLPLGKPVLLKSLGILKLGWFTSTTALLYIPVSTVFLPAPHGRQSYSTQPPIRKKL